MTRTGHDKLIPIIFIAAALFLSCGKKPDLPLGYTIHADSLVYRLIGMDIINNQTGYLLNLFKNYKLVTLYIEISNTSNVRKYFYMNSVVLELDDTYSVAQWQNDFNNWDDADSLHYLDAGQKLSTRLGFSIRKKQSVLGIVLPPNIYLDLSKTMGAF